MAAARYFYAFPFDPRSCCLTRPMLTRSVYNLYLETLEDTSRPWILRLVRSAVEKSATVAAE
jgi:hypothetical protein